MGTKSSSDETMVRNAFGLLLEIRQQRDAARRLGIAVAFLEALASVADADASPVVVAIRALPMRKA